MNNTLTFMGNQTTVNLSIVISMRYHDDVVIAAPCIMNAIPHDMSDEKTWNHCQ